MKALSAAKVASARLRERPCLWKGCKNVLNTGEKLRRHAVEHANLNAKVTEDVSLAPKELDVHNLG